MENLHKRREDHLQKIREAARNIATIESWGRIGERLLNNVVKPVIEAYFNPKKSRELVRFEELRAKKTI